MVESPKTGRELESQKGYTGPQWLARFVRKYVAKKPDENDS